MGGNEQRDRGLGEAAERAVLLATKLHAPVIRGQLVDRTAVVAALSAGERHKLTLLSAPAGWGKTTALAQWVDGARTSEGPQRFAWLSLDTSDNDPVWFWMYIVSALQTVVAGLGGRAVELLTMGADAVQVVLPTLLNDLAGIAGPGPLVLVLDDYHVVRSRAVHEQVAFLISRIPTSFHIVLATRSDPTLPLGRLRANGDLLEVRTENLRFDAGEATHLLNGVHGLDLTDADVHLLYQQTEGWAAGLYLAALSLAGRRDAASFIRTFTGDNRHIADYLMTEVLGNQPPHIRDFLLCTSVLGRLSGELCDAVLQTSESASVLDQIERENLFLVPLDMSRHWYRYHHLFRELLSTELDRSAPDRVAGLHQRAAAWFEAEGLIDEAIRHLVAGGDTAKSADLMAANWEAEFNGGGLSTVSGWLDLISDDIVSRDPRLTAVRAWMAMNVGQFDDALTWIETLGAQLTARAVDQYSLGAQLVALREVHAWKTGDISGALATARRPVALNFDEAPQALSAVYCLYGSALYFAGDTDEAEVAYRQALQWADKIGDRLRRIYALGYLALIAAERGHLTEAERQIRQATGISADLAAPEHFVNAIVSLAAATVLDARGDAAAAVDASYVAVILARKGAGILEVAKALLFRARVVESLGDHQTAQACRAEADTLLRGRSGGIAATALAGAGRPALPRSRPRRESLTVGQELTWKEHEVLRLLATGLSRRQIGERLVVSLNTIKTHQRAVYRKLGVQDRRAAVTRAKELGLL
jgi:LuxR family transcriptional regulator, maltose regulon positive regulatory protein